MSCSTNKPSFLNCLWKNWQSSTSPLPSVSGSPASSQQKATRWTTFSLILSSSAPAPPKDVCSLLFSSPSTPTTAPPTAISQTPQVC
ncbi:hypothetical protein LDENG_00045830 [Lucifuga dentata]|nr:hypothetical protein LDENG_00045830 [Lucifuga dentata]